MKLNIHYMNKITQVDTIVLHSSLDLNYIAKLNSLKRLVSNRVFKSCVAQITIVEELEILKNHRNLKNITFYNNSSSIPMIRVGMIPSHLVSIESDLIITSIEPGSLPQTLQSLSVMEITGPIGIGVFPANLNTLSIYTVRKKLEKEVLPISLTSLSICSYDHPLDPDVLPQGLIEFNFHYSFEDLQFGSIPNSLKVLRLGHYYSQHLNPYVLPKGLTTLMMNENASAIQLDSFPNTLTELHVPMFYNKPFPVDMQLDNLKYLRIDYIHPPVPITNLIRNVKSLHLLFHKIEGETSLYDTAIEYLYLDRYKSFTLELATIKVGFLPKSLKKLRLSGVDFKSSDVIPQSCTSLTTNIKDLDPDLVPSNIKFLNYKK